MASPPKGQVPGCCTLQLGRVLSRARVWRLRRTMARMVRSVKAEITVLVTVRFSGSAEHQVLALIDTGCSIFAVTPRKFFPQATLETARHPLRLSSVNSGGVTGGKLGTSVTVSLPICDSLGGLLCHCPGHSSMKQEWQMTSFWHGHSWLLISWCRAPWSLV